MLLAQGREEEDVSWSKGVPGEERMHLVQNFPKAGRELCRVYVWRGQRREVSRPAALAEPSALLTACGTLLWSPLLDSQQRLEPFSTLGPLLQLPTTEPASKEASRVPTHQHTCSHPLFLLTLMIRGACTAFLGGPGAHSSCLDKDLVPLPSLLFWMYSLSIPTS